MHKILKQLSNIPCDKQQEVVEVSEKLKKALSITEEQFNFMYDNNAKLDIGKYTLFVAERAFTGGWKKVMEIGETSLMTNSQYPYTVHNSWQTNADVKGTRTINLPPETVVAEVLKYLWENAF